MSNENEQTRTLGKFLLQYAALSDEQLQLLTGKFRARQVRKHDFVLRQGEVCSDFIFVHEGCLRLYYVSDEIEVSVWFAFPGSSAIEISSFIQQRPSEYFIQAVEDSEILYLPKQEIESLYRELPPLQELMRKYWEDVAINLIARFTALQRDSADKRYLDLLKKPPYLQVIPQKYLASFIGVTPTSLSRIRKKIGKGGASY